MGSFTASLEKNINKALAEVNDKCYIIAFDLFTTVVSLSPTQPSAKYAKGHFINNWYSAANVFFFPTSPSTSYDCMASLSNFVALKSTRVFHGNDGFVSLSNSLSYARNVEYDGWKQSENPSWSGNVGPYAPVRTALLMTAPKYR